MASAFESRIKTALIFPPPNPVVCLSLMATTLTRENREYIPSAWENVACPFCASRDYKGHEKYGPSFRYTYVQCRECGLVYSSPRPKYDEDFLTAAYSVYDTESHHLKN